VSCARNCRWAGKASHAHMSEASHAHMSGLTLIGLDMIVVGWLLLVGWSVCCANNCGSGGGGDLSP